MSTARWRQEGDNNCGNKMDEFIPQLNSVNLHYVATDFFKQ